MSRSFELCIYDSKTVNIKDFMKQHVVQSDDKIKSTLCWLNSQMHREAANTLGIILICQAIKHKLFFSLFPITDTSKLSNEETANFHSHLSSGTSHYTLLSQFAINKAN